MKAAAFIWVALLLEAAFVLAPGLSPKKDDYSGYTCRYLADNVMNSTIRYEDVPPGDSVQLLDVRHLHMTVDHRAVVKRPTRPHVATLAYACAGMGIWENGRKRVRLQWLLTKDGDQNIHTPGPRGRTGP